MDKVINSFQVNEVWTSGDEATTKTFERVLDAILDSDVSYYEPKRGESFEIGSASILVISPERSYGDLNEGSLAMKITYGDIDFVFTGDAEKEAESDMIKSGLDLSGHIFQAGHHGSVTSNTQAFLDKVQPEVVIYSAGVDNSYGHPHAEVIQRLKDMKVIIYGTDSHGHITVITDGNDYEITTNKIATISVDELTEDQFADVQLIPVDEVIQAAGHVASGSSCTSGQVNINTGDLEDIKKIKHISDKRGSDLISLRPFNTLDDLKRISGIADGRLKDIEEEGIACIE